MNLLEGKPTQSLPSVHQYTGNFDIHTVDFSPLDESTFVVAGYHSLIFLSLSNEGIISRNNSQNQRANVNSDYINKVRTSPMGIFYSTNMEIKLLSWSFKPILTLKSSNDYMLKEWCLLEKKIGCTVYAVTAEGYTEFIDVMPTDEGKKVFTNKVNDGRRKIDTGASILVKEI